MEMNDTDAATSAFLTYAQASRKLQVKKGTLYAWVSRRVIPFVRLSPRVVRFNRADLDTWLRSRSVAPVGRGYPEKSNLETSDRRGTL